MQNPIVYFIPVKDKYIIYAPLKGIAYIGNHALVNLVASKIEGSQLKRQENNKIIQSLSDTGFFDLDKIHFSNCDCNKQFKPTTCILMPTTACNLACSYCYAEYKDKKPVKLSWQTAKQAIDIAFENSKTPQNGRFSLSFHGGGEPTLPQELFLKASGYARKLDPYCSISVTSNCVWDDRFRKAALAVLDEISISFDGNQITQDRQRPDKAGKGTFTRVMETISEIEQRNIRYGIRITVTRDSLPELHSNIQFLCENTTCQSIQVEAVYNQGKAEGTGLTINDVDQFVEAFMNAFYLAKSKGRQISYSSARPHLITNVFCSATSNALIITSDGEITACYEVFDRQHPLAEEFIIGKLNKNTGVELYPGKREQLLTKTEDNRADCKDCFCYFHCAGDCPPKAFLAKRSNDQFRCSVTRAITKELILDRLIENNGNHQ
jgi:uncharacterized protein